MFLGLMNFALAKRGGFNTILEDYDTSKSQCLDCYNLLFRKAHMNNWQRNLALA